MIWDNNQEIEDRLLREEILSFGKLPKHVAIIMDGNGRWATERNMPRTSGHKEGIESVRDIVKAGSLIGLQHLTLYAFSIENWNRPVIEVSGLMNLLELYLKKEVDELHENNVRVLSIGKMSSLPKNIQRLLLKAIEKTKENTGLTLTLALSYSGRWDIVRAVQMIALDVRRGKLSPEDITDNTFASYLQTNKTPDPDFMIRTSGEMRLSNFLLWEMAYGEIYITHKYWPDFRRNDLYEALSTYVNRERRFGKTPDQLKGSNESSQKNYFKKIANAFKNSK